MCSFICVSPEEVNDCHFSSEDIKEVELVMCSAVFEISLLYVSGFQYVRTSPSTVILFQDRIELRCIQRRGTSKSKYCPKH